MRDRDGDGELEFRDAVEMANLDVGLINLNLKGGNGGKVGTIIVRLNVDTGFTTSAKLITTIYNMQIICTYKYFN